MATCEHNWVAGQTFDTYPAYVEMKCSKCGAITTKEAESEDTK